MAKNRNLTAAKKAKNDEFYTQLTDIEKELVHYHGKLRDKIVFCNCDDPEWSNFWRYFDLNFDFIGIKALIATHYDPEKPTYKLEIRRDPVTGAKLLPVRTDLKQNGDFSSSTHSGLLKSPFCFSIAPGRTALTIVIFIICPRPRKTKSWITSCWSISVRARMKSGGSGSSVSTSPALR